MKASVIDGPDSRKRFSPWLEKSLNEGRCPGLEWVDKLQGTFKVPWHHFNRSVDISTHFKVFKDWAVYTGMHLSGGEVDYPKWKRNFRCAINKVSDIVEVPEMHSEKDSVEPYKVYRFVNVQRFQPDPAPGCDDMWVLVKEEEITDTPSLRSFVQIDTPDLVQPVSLRSAEDNATTTLSVSPSQTDANSPTSSPPVLGPNIPTVVMDSLPFFVEASGKTKDPRKPHPMFQKQQRHLKPPKGHQRARSQKLEHSEKPPQYYHKTDKEFRVISEMCRPIESLCVETNVEDSFEILISDEDAAMSLPQNDVVLDLSTKRMSTMVENTSPELANVKHEQVDKQVPFSDKNSIPSDLGSVNSDDLLRMSTRSPSNPASSSLEKERDEKKISPAFPPQPHNNSGYNGAINIKAFYGVHQQKVLERTLANIDKGCRVYFGEPKRDIPGFGERLYGPTDAFQLELPKADICGNATPKQLDFIEAILQEMHRGVVLSASQGDVYARRFCRTRAFVCDQDDHSWPLSRKINIPEKIFNFEIFKMRFEAYKQEVLSGRENSFPPIPYVYLTFGHRVPLENDIRGKVLVAIMVTHIEAEKMLRRFHAGLGIGVASESGSRFLSSMDTMDKVIENYDCMSIE